MRKSYRDGKHETSLCSRPDFCSFLLRPSVAINIGQENYSHSIRISTTNQYRLPLKWNQQWAQNQARINVLPIILSKLTYSPVLMIISERESSLNIPSTKNNSLPPSSPVRNFTHQYVHCCQKLSLPHVSSPVHYSPAQSVCRSQIIHVTVAVQFHYQRR